MTKVNSQCLEYYGTSPGSGNLVLGSFADSLNGFVVDTYGKFYRTSDGGKHWNSFSFSSETITDVEMLDRRTVYFIFRNQILSTSDGGSTWRNRSTPTTYTTYDIAFSTRNYGILVGTSGIVSFTTNSGSSWYYNLPHNTGTSNTLYDAVLLDSSYATVVGQGVIINTTNFGVTWTTQLTSTLTFTAVSFSDKNNGTVVSTNGSIFRTTNSGSTWTQQNSGTSKRLNDVQFIDSLHGVITGKGIILTTSNGGANWIQSYNGSYNWFSVAFMNRSNIITTSDIGLIRQLTINECNSPIQVTYPQDGQMNVPLMTNLELPSSLILTWDYHPLITISHLTVQVSKDSNFSSQMIADVTFSADKENRTFYLQLSNLTPKTIYFCRMGFTYYNQSQVVWLTLTNFTTAGGSISGRVFRDFNQDTIYNSDDLGLKNCLVTLSGNNQGQVVSNSSGMYRFPGMDSGTYQITLTPLPFPWQNTTSLSSTIHLLHNDSLTNVNFGQYNPDWNIISGIVYNDKNENGTYDGLDSTMENWNVRLSLDSQNDTVKTDTTGQYTFYLEETDQCSVQVLPPQGWEKIFPRLVEAYTFQISGGNHNYSNVHFGVHPIPERIKMFFNFHDVSYNRIQSIGFGVRLGASPGIWGVDTSAHTIDYSEGEDELPPRLSDAFDVRFTKPPNSNFQFGGGSWIDMRPFYLPSQVDTYKIIFRTGFYTGGSYPVTFTWSKELVQELYNGDVFFQFPDEITHNLKSNDSIVISDNTIGSVLLIASSPSLPEPPYFMRHGWNLVSNPYYLSNQSVSNLFPSSISNAFSFHSSTGYRANDSLIPGKGYWIKLLNGIFSAPYSGTTRNSDTIEVSAGWNIIGSLSEPISVNSITTYPSDIIHGSFFENTRGYTQADTLKPFYGYWVNSSNNGILILNSSSLISKIESRTEVIDNFDKITIHDAAGNSQSLYFTTDKISRTYELPPLPPDGVFDARFTTNKFVESNEKKTRKEIPIRISSAMYPLSFTWNIKNLTFAILLIDGKHFSLSGTGTTRSVIPIANSSLIFWGNSMLPNTFSLSQNYPNPFNPSTIINYQLPVDNYVTLKVFNLLGQEVATLVDGVQEAGEQSVEWDASGFPSGIYYYKLQAGSFEETRKLLLMK
ncbi:MAG: T9SS type A sorting domain-containing protein [Ignavibacteriae bacterium]|nr:T9SS type A sorting domain-containing protein [Ignavibacteriota bacterium]